MVFHCIVNDLLSSLFNVCVSFRVVHFIVFDGAIFLVSSFPLGSGKSYTRSTVFFPSSQQSRCVHPCILSLSLRAFHSLCALCDVGRSLPTCGADGRRGPAHVLLR